MSWHSDEYYLKEIYLDNSAKTVYLFSYSLYERLRMIEKIKAVNNPLTIIAIFAALAEIAGTVALKLVAPELQYIFIWFVMIFPAILVILFFITLNFNPKVLYAPSDFQNEENFLYLTSGVRSFVRQSG